MKLSIVAGYFFSFIFVPVSVFGFVFNQQKPVVTSAISKEYSHERLSVSGSIPEWLSGTFVQNGPVEVSVNGQKNHHWFDGPAMVHAFLFQQGSLYYTNAFLRTSVYHTIFSEGSLA